VREFTPADLKPLAESGEAFLARRGNSAFNLLAVFAATGDRRLLEQALKQFPNDPAVLYVALSDAPPEERASLIERFKAADPNNPLPWIFSASELFENGRVADAIEVLRDALKRPGLDREFNERGAAVRDLALQSGAGEFTAESIAFFSQTLPHLQAAMKASRGLQAFVDEQKQVALGDVEAIRENAQLLYDLGRMFQTPEASRLLIGQLVGVALERKALDVAASLPESPLPVQAEKRGAELTQIREEATSLSKLASRVFAEPALWRGYFSRFRTDGELPALRWVQQQPQTPAASSSRPRSPLNGLLNGD
jgi:hypothetical protein